MKYPVLCLLALSAPIMVHAAPVHITLKAAAAAAPNADGFLTLGSVAGLSGGDKAARTRFAAVLVARAPLPGETRRLTQGDLALKLRQAGVNPDTQVILEGAGAADVTVGTDPVGAPLAAPFASAPAAPGLPAPALLASPFCLHNGDAVTIYIQSGAMTITAPATARENGRVGDTVRVHRPGVMADLSVQVVDAQTVQMEI